MLNFGSCCAFYTHGQTAQICQYVDETVFKTMMEKSTVPFSPLFLLLFLFLSAFIMSEKEKDKSWGCSLQLTSAAGLLPGKWESSRWLECWKCQRSEGSRDTMRLEGKDRAAALNWAANIRRLWCGLFRKLHFRSSWPESPFQTFETFFITFYESSSTTESWFSFNKGPHVFFFVDFLDFWFVML